MAPRAQTPAHGGSLGHCPWAGARSPSVLASSPLPQLGRHRCRLRPCWLLRDGGQALCAQGPCLPSLADLGGDGPGGMDSVLTAGPGPRTRLRIQPPLWTPRRKYDSVRRKPYLPSVDGVTTLGGTLHARFQLFHLPLSVSSREPFMPLMLYDCSARSAFCFRCTKR